MNTEIIKVRVEIENKEEISDWVNGLVERWEKANSLADEPASKNDIVAKVVVSNIAEPTRRFIPLRDKSAEAFKKLKEEKGLTREDLIIIFQNFDINESVFPEIAEARQAARKNLHQG